METPSPSSAEPRATQLKVFGVGSAGVNILELLERSGFSDAKLIAVNTDAKSLLASAVSEKLCVESKLMRGLGTGGDPERGRAAAEQHLEALKLACAGTDVVFILAGLGGGAGTGISPFLAQVAHESGALVLAFVTLPFECEGNRRLRQADQGFEELKAAADAVICLPSQKLFRLIDEETTALDTFKLSDQLLADGVAGIARLISGKGLIQLHFEDLCSSLRDRHGESHFATAEAAGAARSREVTDKLLAHPLLDGGKILAEADAVLVSITGGPDLTMAEINRVMEHINSKCSKSQVTMGAAVMPEFQERLAVTLVATHRAEPGRAKSIDAVQTPARTGPEELNTQMHSTEMSRPQSRFVPPLPEMTPEKREALISGGTGRMRRAGKAGSKMRQAQLPLDIVSKGRFDQSEPTIHKGEDLDVPTYIRRGVALN